MTIHICRPKTYEFNGVYFEFGHAGPWPLTKDGDPKKRAGRGFYKRIDQFLRMTPAMQEACRVGGGCEVHHG